MNPRGAGARGAGERAREISRADRTSEKIWILILCKLITSFKKIVMIIHDVKCGYNYIVISAINELC